MHTSKELAHFLSQAKTISRYVPFSFAAGTWHTPTGKPWLSDQRFLRVLKAAYPGSENGMPPSSSLAEQAQPRGLGPGNVAFVMAVVSTDSQRITSLGNL